MAANLNDPTLGDVMATARLYLNDIEGITWTDAHLLPLAQEAHRELQLHLSLNDIAVVRVQITNGATSQGIHVPAGTVSLNTAGLMPANLLEPLILSERDWGDTTPEDYLEMQRVAFLPNYTQDTFLWFWVWMGEDIIFNGATTDRDIQIRYRCSLTTPTNMQSSIGFLRGELYVGPRTAALACQVSGNSKDGDKWQKQALVNLDMIIRSNVKNDQGVGVRRTPYRRGNVQRIY
jgi:hypothetical protein